MGWQPICSICVQCLYRTSMACLPCAAVLHEAVCTRDHVCGLEQVPQAGKRAGNVPVRPWRSVPSAVPAATQLTLLATPESVRFTSPRGWHPLWGSWTAASVALTVAFYGALAAMQPATRAFGISCLGVGAMALVGWLVVLARPSHWFELEVTRTTWRVSLVWPLRSGCTWQRSRDSGPTAELCGAKVCPRVLA